MIAQIAISSPSKPRGEHYEECIGAKKHLVVGLLPNSWKGSNSFGTGL